MTDIVFNCDCDDTSGNRSLSTLRTTLMALLGFADPLGDAVTRTLVDMRKDLMRRLGFAAQADNPPPGMADLLASFLNEAEQVLWRRLELDKAATAPPTRMAADADACTLDNTMVFALALATAKAHYGKDDAKLYLQEVERMLADYTARRPPNIVARLNALLIDAQTVLYRRYDVLRTERTYTWATVAGTRYYDLDANSDVCTKRLDPRKVTWVGASSGDDRWYPLRCGIPPELYDSTTTGQPERYEIRQCLEIWPAPADTTYKIRIKGHFGLEAFAADADVTTIDDELVLALATANAKTGFKQPDASNYVAQMETMLQNLVAGSHQTRRYIPGRDARFDPVYVRPTPTVPFS